MNLNEIGFEEQMENSFAPFREQGLVPGRVALEHKHIYRVWTEHGELLADISGKMRFTALARVDYPAVGDWVMVSARPDEMKGTIHGILPRKSKFSRKMAGNEIDEQIVATNVDTVFIVGALNHDFNLRRLERYLVLAWESGAMPVIVLSKADLCEDLDEKRQEVEEIAIGVPVIPVSAQTGDGMEDLLQFLTSGSTVALMGSSGVGKSTLANYFMGGEVLKTQAVREDDARGRHTTTHRELLLLPSGAVLIDTPGMREIQLWDAGDGLSSTFEDVESIAASCLYNDCQHRAEPGCAVKEALQNGSLSEQRYESYNKLQRELAYLASKEDRKLAQANKDKWKAISKHQKNGKKVRY